MTEEQFDAAAAREYLDEAQAAYDHAVARGDKQVDLRERGRTLTEAMVGAMEAGVEI